MSAPDSYCDQHDIDAEAAKLLREAHPYTVGYDTDLPKRIEAYLHSGPNKPAVDALMGVLDEIEDYLEQRQDIRDGSDGAQLSNTEMSLLSDLRWWRSASGLTGTPATVGLEAPQQKGQDA